MLTTHYNFYLEISKCSSKSSARQYTVKKGKFSFENYMFKYYKKYQEFENIILW